MVDLVRVHPAWEGCCEDQIPALSSDAIIKPRIVFSNGFETLGQIGRMGNSDSSFEQSLAPDITGAGVSFGDTVAPALFGAFMAGGLIFNASGGRENGGYVTTRHNPITRGIGDKEVQRNYGNFIAYRVPTVSTSILNYGAIAWRRNRICCGFNFFGQAPPRKLPIIGFGNAFHSSDPDLTAFNCVTSLDIDTNFTLGVRTVTDNLTVTEYSDDFIVPANDWFWVEFDCGHQLTSNIQSGFAVVRMHRSSDPVEGVNALSAINVAMANSVIDMMAVGSSVRSVVSPLSAFDISDPGVDGIGIDDLLLCAPEGGTKRWFGSIFVAQSVPISDGDEQHSTIAYDSTHTSSVTGAIEGWVNTHGDANRWKNIDGRTNRQAFASVGTNWDDDVSYGNYSSLTHTWLEGDDPPFGVGPYTPPYSANSSYTSRFDVSIYNSYIRNSLHDEQLDLYSVDIIRPGVLQLEGIMPFWRAGWPQVLGKTFFVGGLGGYGDFFSGIEKHVQHLKFDFAVGTFDDNADINRHLGKWVFKDGSGLYTTPSQYHMMSGVRYDSGPLTGSPSGIWGTCGGYNANPYNFLIVHPTNGNSFLDISPGLLKNVQVGAQGSFALYDTDPTPLDSTARWIQFDLCEIGFDYVYRKLIPNFIEHPAFPPIAWITNAVAFDIGVTRIASVTDAADDWNLVGDNSGIATRMIDWGDGTSQVAITALATINHTYATPGNYIVTEHVTNTLGLSAQKSIGPFKAFIPATVSFTDTNPTGNEVDFTDTSTAHDEVISGWHWDFGDGNTSTSQNPTHVYATTGTYIVVLTLTTNLSSPAVQTSQSITVPFVESTPGVVSGCTPSAKFMANTVDVQGDDYNGDNPPLPAYVDTAAFAGYYFTGAHPRQAYDFDNANFNDGINFIIDTVNTFHGHSTLKMAWGKPAANEYDGAGWFTKLTDDGDPTETIISSNKQWLRVRFFGQPGIMSDPFHSGGLASDSFFGQGILEVDNGGGQYSLTTRNGHLYLDSFNGAGFIDPGIPDTIILGAGYVDVLMLYDGSTAGQVRTAFWIEQACNLAGKSPRIDNTFTGLTENTTINHALSTLTSEGCYFFQPYMNATGPLKYVWVADWETMPFSVDGNPFGVAGI